MRLLGTCAAKSVPVLFSILVVVEAFENGFDSVDTREPKLFFFFFFNLFIYGCVGSSFLCEGSLQLRRAGASYYRGLSCCGAQPPDAQAQ